MSSKKTERFQFCATQLGDANSSLGDANSSLDEVVEYPWRTPRQTIAPLPECLGSSLCETPAWFNNPSCQATSPAGTQSGATCGLFAVNHLLHSAAVLGISEEIVLNKGDFEYDALNAGLQDDAEHLIQPGDGANYDQSVLSYHIGERGLRSHPMPPDVLETQRLQDPFSDFYFEHRRFRCVGYLIRTPQYNGHWIALLPYSVLNGADNHAAAGVLCDSMFPEPFSFTSENVEDLLTACALESVSLQSRNDPNAYGIQWACFLITDAGQSL